MRSLLESQALYYARRLEEVRKEECRREAWRRKMYVMCGIIIGLSLLRIVLAVI